MALLPAPSAQAATTINPIDKYAYGANFGWVDWRGDVTQGAEVNARYLAGSIYSANVGWIHLGDGSPDNGLSYSNASATDYGVNVDAAGNLSGYAYGANIGWITFAPAGNPQVNKVTGQFTGHAYAANAGWISLDTAESDLITDVVPTPPTAARLAYFQAVRASDGHVNLTWRTLIETHVLGFRVERQMPGVGWVRVNERLLPSAGQSRPWGYSVTDPPASAAGTGRYRLLEVDIRGVERAVAEATVTRGVEVSLDHSDAGITLTLMGDPGALVVVEEAEDVSGPWRRLTRLTLEKQGTGLLRLDAPLEAPTRFLRVVQPFAGGGEDGGRNSEL